jgi:hypothetical protein
VEVLAAPAAVPSPAEAVAVRAGVPAHQGAADPVAASQDLALRGVAALVQAVPGRVPAVVVALGAAAVVPHLAVRVLVAIRAD